MGQRRRFSHYRNSTPDIGMAFLLLTVSLDEQSAPIQDPELAGINLSL